MEKTRERLFEAMGELPNPAGPVGGRLIDTEDKGSFFLEHLSLDLNGYEKVPALFTRPKKAAAPYPAVLFNHSHGNLFHLGKTELLCGCPYMLPRGYAEDLAAEGIAALCIDHMCFEDRSGRTESFVYKKLIWDGYYMWAWMVFDSLRALEYLCRRDDVDENRIGAVGMSMGSAMTQWVAALDDRIKACVDICCLTNFDELEATGALDGHGIYYYIPGLRRRFGCSDINALIAPRAHLSLAGLFDPLTPTVGLARDNETLAAVYARAGKPENWRQILFPTGHIETYEMHMEALAFLTAHL